MINDVIIFSALVIFWCCKTKKYVHRRKRQELLFFWSSTWCMYHGFVSERQDFGAPDLSHSPQSQMLVPTRQPHHHEGSVKNTRWDVYDTESKMRRLVCIISLKCPRRQSWWHVYVSMLSCIRWTGHLAGSYLSWPPNSLLPFFEDYGVTDTTSTWWSSFQDCI